MPSEELTARIAYVDFDGVKALSAVEMLNSKNQVNDEFLEYYCGNILKAIDLIIDWISD
jgi:aspartate aminotransferase